MLRVLVFGMTENYGGVERFLWNYFQYLDYEKIHFDFLCNSYEEIAYEKELKEAGAEVFHIPARSKSPLLYLKKISSFFRKHKGCYDIIWVNVCSLANIDYLMFAKKYGIKRRIIHSHNTKNMDGLFRGILHHVNRAFIRLLATDFWACSEEAAHWFYGRKRNKHIVIIKNAINIKEMRYQEVPRKRIRSEKGLDNCYVIGSIGRLHFQKNQKWILLVFSKVLSEIPNARLVLIGQGEDEDDLKRLARELHVEEKVLWMGVQRNIGDWLSAFDLLVFPSLFEGVPFSVIEAQANGVPVLASLQAVREEGRINPNCIRFSLKHTSEEWAAKIVEIKNSVNRISYLKVRHFFKKTGYEIEQASGVLQHALLYGKLE